MSGLKHGHRPKGRRSPTYESWRSMLERCYRKRHVAYGRYGGRGIRVCTRWRGKTGFANFLADMGERPSGFTLERVNNAKGYSPTNCEWSTMTQQLRNRRNNRMLTLDGVTRCVSEWAEALGLKHSTILERKRAGWSDEDTLRTPARAYKRAA